MSFGRLERPARTPPLCDINMTPFIDVMLVLMVIFIITAPLMTPRLPLELPKADAAATPPKPSMISVAINAQGEFFWGDESADVDALRAQLASAAQSNANAEVFIRADQAVAYGRVAELIGWVQKAGLTRIGFVAQPASK